MNEETLQEGARAHWPARIPTTIEEFRAALSKLQRDLSEALLLLSRMNRRHTAVLQVLTEKGLITREQYTQIHKEVIAIPP